MTPTLTPSLMSIGFLDMGSAGAPPLDLSGLTVLAHYDLADPSAVWANSGRTTPATEGGRVIGLTDLSGNGWHGFFTGTGAFWRDGAADVTKENAVTDTCAGLRITGMPWNSRNIAMHLLWEPVSRYGSLNKGAWWFSDYNHSFIIPQHNLAATSSGPSTFVLPGIGGNPHTITLPLHADRMACSLQLGASNIKIFRDGSVQTISQAPPLSSITSGWQLGGSASAFGSGFAGYRLRRLILTQAASDSRIQQLHTDLQAQWTGLAASKAQNWFFAGDSITVGYGAENKPYWKQLLETNSTIRPWVGAIGGCAAYGSTQGLDALLAPEAAMPAMGRVVLMIGFNDCKYSQTNANFTAANIQGAISSWLTSYGGSDFVICTIAPEFFLTGASLTLKNTLNTWIRSTYGSNVLDLDTAGIVANSSSADFYLIPPSTRDSVHLSAQGHRKIAVALATKLGLNQPPAL
jgi:lysophospholipase L1-like esterase